MRRTLRWAALALLFTATPALAQPVSQDFLNLERTLITTGNAAQALPSLQAQSLADPDNPELWFLLGMAQRTIGDEASAANAFARCAELAPDQPRALL